jgi:hypothetical protein
MKSEVQVVPGPSAIPAWAELCALVPLRYSLGHGIAIASCAPMARVHPALQPRGPRGSILWHALPAQLCLPNLWRPDRDLGARTPHRLARQDRRINALPPPSIGLPTKQWLPRMGLTQRSRWEPTAPPGAGRLNSRATSVPVTAVLNGPQRTATDNSTAASTWAVPAFAGDDPARTGFGSRWSVSVHSCSVHRSAMMCSATFVR